MELFILLATAFGVYLLWKRWSNINEKTRGKRIEAEVFGAAGFILALRDTDIPEEQFHEHMTRILLNFIKNIEDIRRVDSIIVGSFAHSYLTAITVDDRKYTDMVNFFIARQIIRSRSHEDRFIVLTDFLLRPPTAEYSYSLDNPNLRQQYSTQYISEMETLLGKNR